MPIVADRFSCLASIIVAVSAIDKLPNISEVGGLIGPSGRAREKTPVSRADPRLDCLFGFAGVSVSASFLFILGEVSRTLAQQALVLN